MSSTELQITWAGKEIHSKLLVFPLQQCRKGLCVEIFPMDNFLDLTANRNTVFQMQKQKVPQTMHKLGDYDIQGC